MRDSCTCVSSTKNDQAEMSISLKLCYLLVFMGPFLKLAMHKHDKISNTVLKTGAV